MNKNPVDCSNNNPVSWSKSKTYSIHLLYIPQDLRYKFNSHISTMLNLLNCNIKVEIEGKYPHFSNSTNHLSYLIIHKNVKYFTITYQHNLSKSMLKIKQKDNRIFYAKAI